MSGLHEEANDATPLSAEEREGLIPSHVTLRGELNELEQQNILGAMTWTLARRHDPLSEPFARGLHRRMFGQVWRWAGEYRRTDKNIGDTPSWQVQLKLYEAFDAVRYWIDHATFPPDEIAARFHRDLVWIHPFPNGNGRWAREMADVLLAKMGQRRFSWGGGSLGDADATRDAYIAALKAADRQDFAALLEFSRS